MWPVRRTWQQYSLYPNKSNPVSSPSNEEAEETRDWAGLMEDPLRAILSQINSLDDFYAFRGVCTNWRSVAALSPENLSSLNPLVLVHIQVRWRDQHDCHALSLRDVGSDLDEISKDDDAYSGPDEVSKDDDSSESDMSESDWYYIYRPTFEVRLFDIVEKRFYRKPLSLSSWRSCNYLNFAHGYLAIAFGDGRIQLRHFLTNEKIWLPKTSIVFSDEANIVFSENPSSSGCMFAIFEQYSRTVQLYLPHREFQWVTYKLSGDDHFMDMIFFEGDLYALLASQDFFFQLAVFEFTPNITLRELANPLYLYEKGAYLTSMGGQLLLFSGRFFVLDFVGQRWIERNNFDGGSMFLSYWQCHASIAPALNSKVKPNQWYRFDTDDSTFMEAERDSGVKEDDVDLLELIGDDVDSMYIGRPVWIFPSMCA